MSYMRDAIIRLGVEMQPTNLQPPSYQPIMEQEKRLAAIYKERAAACVSAEQTIRAEYSKTAAVLREIVGLERSRGAVYGRGGGGAVTPGLYSGGGGGAAVSAAGIRSGAGAMTLGYGGGGNVGSGWAGSSSRFMGQYGNFGPSGPSYGFQGGSVAAGGSRSGWGGAQWLMGTYGAGPTAPAAAAGRGSGGSVSARGYDARNTAFNTGNPFWDRMRNRFGFGPFDAIGNQLRGWGGAIGAGVGAYAGSQFGELGMIAGAATGQTVGQIAGYMGTTGVGRQMLIRGAEAVATSGFGRGVAGGLAGAAMMKGAGFLGAGVGASLGAVALPVTAAAAIGYGGNRAVNAIGNSFRDQWIWAHNQDRWNADNPQTQLMRSQAAIGNLSSAIANSGAIFNENLDNRAVGFGKTGFAAADAIQSQRRLLNFALGPGTFSGRISRGMINSPEMMGDHLYAAQEGIRRRQAIIANIGEEVGFRREGVSQVAQAESRLQSATADVQTEKARIRGAEAALGGAGARDKAEFWRITTAMSQGARINVDDLSTLESVAGQDNRVKDYVERERRRFYKNEGFGRRLDDLFGRGDVDLIGAQDRQAEAQKAFDKVSPDGETAAEVQKKFDEFLAAITGVVESHQAEIERLNKITRQIKTPAPGS